MTEIEFVESAFGPACVVVAARRMRLLDVCDEARAPLPFGCRAARCTTCRVLVLGGADLLSAPAAEETELLRGIEAPAGVRLGCQMVVRGDPGRVQIRALGPLDPPADFAG